jgi:hypothetical protein
MKRALALFALVLLACVAVGPANATIYQHLPCGGVKVNGGYGHYHSVTRWYYQEGYWTVEYRVECVGILNGLAQYARVPYQYYVPGYWYPVQEYIWVPDPCW